MNENHLAPCRAAPQRFFEERRGGASEEPHLRSPVLPWEGCLLSQLSKTDGESHFLKDRHKIKQLLQYVLYKPAPGNVLVILNVCYVLF